MRVLLKIRKKQEKQNKTKLFICVFQENLLPLQRLFMMRAALKVCKRIFNRYDRTRQETTLGIAGAAGSVSANAALLVAPHSRLRHPSRGGVCAVREPLAPRRPPHGSGRSHALVRALPVSFVALSGRNECCGSTFQTCKNSCQLFQPQFYWHRHEGLCVAACAAFCLKLRCTCTNRCKFFF